MAISQNTFAVALCILVARVQGQETVKTFADLGGKPYDVRDVETWGAGFSWLRVSRPILPLHLYVRRGGRGVRSVSSRKRAVLGGGYVSFGFFLLDGLTNPQPLKHTCFAGQLQRTFNAGRREIRAAAFGLCALQ